MGMIFRASGSSFGFKKRNDEPEAANPNIPELNPEEALRARVLAYKLASKALLYGTLINAIAALIFMAVLYFVFDIKTTKELKDCIRKFIRGEDALKGEEHLVELTPEEGMNKLKDRANTDNNQKKTETQLFVQLLLFHCAAD